MSKKSRPTLPGASKRIPRRGWKELRAEFGAKKAKRLLAGLKGTSE
jgi:hypothetical protein